MKFLKLKKYLQLERMSRFVFVLLYAITTVYLILGSGVVSANSLSEGYSSKENFDVGLLVSLDDDNPKNVVLADSSNVENFLGVVVEKNGSSINFNKEGAEVAVSLTGDVVAYVSDFNGDIKKGDQVSVSALKGIGIKTSGNDEIIGVAVEDASNFSDYGEIPESNINRNIKIGTVRLHLLGSSILSTSSYSESGSTLHRFLHNITGKEVSGARFIVGVVVFLLSVTLAGIFIFSAIKSSLISIGRNPLSGTTIYKSLIGISGTSVSVLLIGAALSYVVWVM